MNRPCFLRHYRSSTFILLLFVLVFSVTVLLTGWGQGVNFNSLNQPSASLSYQKKYGSFQADFIDAARAQGYTFELP